MVDYQTHYLNENVAAYYDAYSVTLIETTVGVLAR